MNVGMVFAMIFAIIVIMLFFIYGFDAIQNFTCVGNEAKVSKSLNDLKSVVDDLYLQAEGSSNEFRLNLPADAEFCFVNPASPERNPTGGWTEDDVIINYIRNEYANGVGYTLYYAHCSGKDFYELKRIQPASNFCIQSGRLYLENQGFYVSVEEY